MFKDESWERIEGFAARAWCDCGLGEAVSWSGVAKDVRQAFLAG